VGGDGDGDGAQAELPAGEETAGEETPTPAEEAEVGAPS